MTERYVQLLRRSADIASGISAVMTDDPQRQWIIDRARELSAAVSIRSQARGIGPADEMIDRAAAFVRGEDARVNAALWERFNSEWPMGVYANACADAVRQHVVWNDRVLEIGSGTGATCRQLADVLGPGFVRTDLHAKLLSRVSIAGQACAWNLDDFVPDQVRAVAPYRVVFGTNVMHCTRHPRLSMQRIWNLIEPSGWLILSEGTPLTTQTTPHAITWVSGIFDGWWNRGGFKAERDWLALGPSDHRTVVIEEIREDSHHLGAVYAWRKQA